jgi:hypothetical protein
MDEPLEVRVAFMGSLEVACICVGCVFSSEFSLGAAAPLAGSTPKDRERLWADPTIEEVMTAPMGFIAQGERIGDANVAARRGIDRVVDPGATSCFPGKSRKMAITTQRVSVKPRALATSCHMVGPLTWLMAEFVGSIRDWPNVCFCGEAIDDFPCIFSPHALEFEF